MTDNFTALLEQLKADPEKAAALIAAFQGTQPTKPATKTVTPCPAAKDITMVQATFFDNGEKGKRDKYMPEFMSTLEVWTDPADKIRLSKWAWKQSARLVEHVRADNDFLTLKRRGSITDGYYDELMATWIMLKQPDLNSPIKVCFGLLVQKIPGQGTFYHDRQFLTLAMQDRLPAVMNLHLAGEVISISAWSDRMSNGELLKGHAQRQARLDLCSYSVDWATQ
ncbi:hypothetical protein SLNSH_23165 [Alsobacter soli]|uniref:Uncharacterized protein n=1 Tax=Alsobacter soli TaxID=2109933 RepID=A0A2T1HLT0_9HYPH|nr:hypothetical protein [Alsobacter soli]PSC02607.1 hypothetical protein SLNSH_23165 [Alsobacter soli]